MTGRFPPVARMGGKRAYADGVLDILGTWPKRWLLIDADLAVAEFWKAAFAGLLPVVAEVIRNAPADGEELWRLWAAEPVPFDPVERVARWQVVQAGQHAGVPVASDGERWILVGGPLSWKYPGDAHPRSATALRKKLLAAMTERVARWIVLQKGNFSAKPLSYGEEGWRGVAGIRPENGPIERAAGFKDRHGKLATVRKLLAPGWSGLAGFASLSPSAYENGYRDRIVREDLAHKVGALQPIGEALYLDLSASSPIVFPGDLVTIDPPYRGTSGYGATLSRERVAEMAEQAHEAGARVLVHEAEPVLEGGPWRSLELRRTRGAGQRTWSRQKREVITINFEPATEHAGAAKDRAAVRREMTPITGPLFENGT